MIVKYVEVGVCGLSCRLCPAFYRETTSRCPGCKSEFRMGAPCPYVNCAVNKKGVEFCWDCLESKNCARWQKHERFGIEHDSFVSYQKIRENSTKIQKEGITKFVEQQQIREKLLREMLSEFNEGRSKSFYCVAATVLEIPELKEVLEEARRKSAGLTVKEKAQAMSKLLDELAVKRGYLLKLRK